MNNPDGFKKGVRRGWGIYEVIDIGFNSKAILNEIEQNSKPFSIVSGGSDILPDDKFGENGQSIKGSSIITMGLFKGLPFCSTCD